MGGAANGAVIVTGDDNVVGDDNVILRIEAGDTLAALSRLFLSRQHQLPARVDDFEGRGSQIEDLLGALRREGGRAAITAIGGLGGIGKSALAVEVGHQLIDAYLDGQLFVELGGTSEQPLSPAAAMAQVIQSFEPAAKLPEGIEELTPTLHGSLI